MKSKHVSVMLCLVFLSAAIVLSSADDQGNFDEEELLQELPLTPAEKYVDFLSNGGAMSDDSDYPNEEPENIHERNVQDDVDYETETLDMLLKTYQESYSDLSPKKSKKKLEGHIAEMDLDGDGYVSREELSKWLIAQAEKGATLETMGMSGLETFDLDNDNKLSWDEVFDDLKKLGNIESPGFKSGIETEKIRFAHADKNKDTLLDDTEYPKYASPEYFTEMSNYTVLSYIADFDQDKDLKISKEEFLRGFDKESDKPGYEFEMRKFDKMDKDKNGFLSTDEVSNVALEFSIQTIVDKRVNTLFFHVDTDKDGKLSTLEILSSSPLFTGGKVEDDDTAEYNHDEL